MYLAKVYVNFRLQLYLALSHFLSRSLTHYPSLSPSPFDKDDQTSSSSTVSKRFLSNQSPPDTPSMREQVFYVSHTLASLPLSPALTYA